MKTGRKELRGKNRMNTMIILAFFGLHARETQAEHGGLTELRRHEIKVWGD